MDRADQTLERQVIAACIRTPSKIPLIFNFVTNEHFTNEILAKAYEVIQTRYKAGEGVDFTVIRSIVNKSIKKEKEVSQVLEEARNEDLDEVNIEATCRLLNNWLQVRRLERLADSAKDKLYRGEFADSVISYMSEGIKDISESTIVTDQLYSLDDILEKNPLKHSAIYDGSSGGRGIASPWADLDSLTGGFKPGRYYIIAARPSFGKTALVAQLGYYAAKRGKRVVVFSHETDRELLWRRIAGCYGNIPVWDMENGELTKDEKQKVVGWLDANRTVPLYISDCSGRTPYSMEAELRKYVSRYGPIDMCIVDYLQLMKTRSKQKQSRYEEVTEISEFLNQSKKTFNCSMIALSQLSRGIENRDDPRPQNSDLRESGQIEQDADAIAFIHRPGMMNIKIKHGKEEKRYDKAYTELILTKQRQGRLGTVKLEFQGEYARFREWEEGRPIEV